MSASTAAAEPVMPAVLNAPELNAPRKVSVQEYFELERNSEIRYEYYNGKMIAMPGVSLSHNTIAGNIHTEFNIAFRGRSCRVFMESIRVRVTPTQYRYPDVVALCGQPVTDGENPPALLNPQVIFEALSPSTQHIDRGVKLLEYQQVSSITDYVIAAQDRISILHHVRQGERQWTITEYISLDDTLHFASLNVTVALRAIYDKIEFSNEEYGAAESAA